MRRPGWRAIVRHILLAEETGMAEPVCAQKEPYAVDVEAGRAYFWCACGRSQKQPFCDGSHVGTDFKPFKFTIEEPVKDIQLCGCKLTSKRPFCDGESCCKLRQERENAKQD